MTPEPDWTRGIPLSELRIRRELFDIWDEGLVLGAFSGVKENRIAAWIDDGLAVEGPDSFIVARVLSRRQSVRDFTGETRVVAPPGAVSIQRIACAPWARRDLLDLLRETIADRPVVAVGWIEGDDARVYDALGLDLAGTKIAASSELFGIWHRGCEVAPIAEADLWTMAEGSASFDPAPLAAELARVEPTFADHYSGYNKRHSWSACALRSFGGSPTFIEKPAEMARAWKAAHAEELTWVPEWTPLADEMPETRRFVDRLPCEVERVRFMRLAGGSGELTRHADITDRSAGTRDGAVMRLHFPIVTNPDVKFRAWDLLGNIGVVHMAAGSCWYLDTRKPHAARNLGSAGRVHLVADCIASPELRALFAG